MAQAIPNAISRYAMTPFLFFMEYPQLPLAWVRRANIIHQNRKKRRGTAERFKAPLESP
jgi:hypothetical protein